MTVVARYTWGKTEKGYGWHLWEGCRLFIERDGKTGYWGVHDADGSRLCLCVDYRGAQKVVGRLRRAELSRLIPDSGKDFALLTETREGWTYNGYSSCSDSLCGSGKTFATRKEAEAYIEGRELIPKP
jgi:hypothetical protein